MENISPEKKTFLIDQNKDMSFLFSKSKRIVSAIYLVTSLFPENEPIKDEIRKTSLSFISNSFYRTFTSEFKSIKDYLIGLLEIAHDVGLLSLMNKELIVKEILSVSPKSTERTQIPESFFAVSEQTVLSESKTNNSHHISPINNTPVHSPVKQTTPTKRSYSDSDLKKEKRRRDIIAFVRKKREITVKDVGIFLTDCSEKTLQRELISMVEEGLLNKEGERRWSKYSLPR